MTLDQLIKQIKNQPETIEFDDVISTMFTLKHVLLMAQMIS